MMATCYTVVAYHYGTSVPIGGSIAIDVRQLPWSVDVKVMRYRDSEISPVPLTTVKLLIDGLTVDSEMTGLTGKATFRITDVTVGNHIVTFEASMLSCSDEVACASAGIPDYENCDPPTETILVAAADASACEEGTEICIDGFVYVCHDNEWLKTDETCGLPTECSEGDQDCRDGVIWECIGGKWLNTGVSCEPPPPVCDEGDQTCIDNDIWVCYNNAWVDTNIPCTVPPECTEGESECRDGYVWRCVDGVMINTGESCLPVCVPGESECIDGEEYLCLDGQWVSTGLPCDEGWDIPVELLVAGGLGVAAVIGYLLFRGSR